MMTLWKARTHLREVACGVGAIESPENTSQSTCMTKIARPYGRPLAVMSVACPPVEKRSDKDYTICETRLLDQVSWVPADQSLPSRPNASKFQLTSKATHGEAFTVAEAERSKRETMVGASIIFLEKWYWSLGKECLVSTTTYLAQLRNKRR